MIFFYGIIVDYIPNSKPLEYKLGLLFDEMKMDSLSFIDKENKEKVLRDLAIIPDTPLMRIVNKNEFVSFNTNENNFLKQYEYSKSKFRYYDFYEAKRQYHQYKINDHLGMFYIDFVKHNFFELFFATYLIALLSRIFISFFLWSFKTLRIN
jgi:hypothetical protein